MREKKINFDDIEKNRSKISDDNPYKAIFEMELNDIREFDKRMTIDESDLSIKLFSKYPSGVVEVDKLYTLLNGVQNLVASAANDLYGNRNSMGPIPTEIYDSSRMLITSVMPGSFVLNFDFADGMLEPRPMQFFAEDHKHFEIKEVVEQLFIELESIDSTEDNREVLTRKYGLRTIQQAVKLFKDIDRKGVNFVFENSGSKLALDFDNDAVSNINRNLNLIKIIYDESTLNVNGKLTGFDVHKGFVILDSKDLGLIKIMFTESSLSSSHFIANNDYSFSVNVVKTIDIDSGKIIDTKYHINTLYSD